MPGGMGGTAAERSHLNYGSKSRLGRYRLGTIRDVMCDAKRATEPVSPIIAFPAPPESVVSGTAARGCGISGALEPASAGKPSTNYRSRAADRV